MDAHGYSFMVSQHWGDNCVAEFFTIVSLRLVLPSNEPQAAENPLRGFPGLLLLAKGYLEILGKWGISPPNLMGISPPSFLRIPPHYRDPRSPCCPAHLCFVFAVCRSTIGFVAKGTGLSTPFGGRAPKWTCSLHMRGGRDCITGKALVSFHWCFAERGDWSPYFLLAYQG